VTPYLKQVVFPNSFQNPKEAFLLQNPSFLDNKPVFQKPKSKYIFKTTFQNILTMEEGFYHENPSIAASKIFPPNWHYKPWNLAKPQSYYVGILEITNFVKFKHFKLHSDHTEPTYSTCIIHKVIHLKDWGQPLHQPLSFPIHFRTNPQDFNTSYTYWDYQQAW
jgi:hypothetical protein